MMTSETLYIWPRIRKTLFREYGILVGLVAFVQLVIPLPPLYWGIIGVIGVIAVRIGIRIVRLTRDTSLTWSLTRHSMIPWGIELALLGAITVFALGCKFYAFTFDFPAWREAVYVAQFTLYSALLYGACGVLMAFHSVSVLSTPKSSRPSSPALV